MKSIATRPERVIERAGEVMAADGHPQTCITALPCPTILDANRTTIRWRR